jgi:16S rRNA (guanine527-N7)-methyltransferase
LAPETAARFETYFHLLIRWNARTNLTAIRDEEGILRRHFLESIACSRALPAGIATLLDFGSGAGFPGIPISLCRPHLAVTLAESQGKKAAFLREAVRTLGIQAAVHAGRAETLRQTFDCVTLRAVDRMDEAIRAAPGLIAPRGWLAPLTTSSESSHIQTIAGSGFRWEAPIALAGGVDRALLLGQRLD